MSRREKVKNLLLFFLRVDIMLLGLAVCIGTAVLGVTLPAMFVYHNTHSIFLTVGTILAIAFLFSAPWTSAIMRLLTWAMNIQKALGGFQGSEDRAPRT